MFSIKIPSKEIFYDIVFEFNEMQHDIWRMRDKRDKKIVLRDNGNQLYFEVKRWTQRGFVDYIKERDLIKNNYSLAILKYSDFSPHLPKKINLTTRERDKDLKIVLTVCDNLLRNIIEDRHPFRLNCCYFDV